MKFVVEINKEKVIETAELFLRKAVTYVYQWLTHEGELLGYVLAVLHATIGIGIAVAILIAFTVYPNFWFQVVLILFAWAVTIQHLILNVCVVAIAEKNLTNGVSPFYKFVEDVLSSLHIDFQSFIQYFICLLYTSDAADE